MTSKTNIPLNISNLTQGSFGSGNVLSQITGQFGGGVSSTGSYADIAWFQQAVSGASGDKNVIPNLAVNLGYKIAEKYVFGGLFGMGNNPTVEANQSIKSKTGEITTLGNQTQAKVDANQKQIDDIMAQVQANLEEISKNLAAIESQTKEKDDLEQKIKKHTEKIELAQGVLANPDASDEEKSDAQREIEVAGIAIATIAASVEKLSVNIAKNNENTTGRQKQNDELNRIKSVVDANINQIYNDANQQVQLMVKNINVEFQQQAAIKEAEAVKLEAEAAAIEASGKAGSLFTFGASGVASSLKAAQLYATAELNRAASKTYTGGIPTMTSLSQEKVNVPLMVGVSNFNMSASVVDNYIGQTGTTLTDYFTASNSLGSSLIIENGGDLLAQAGEEVIDAAGKVETGEDNKDNNSDSELTKPLEALQELIV